MSIFGKDHYMHNDVSWQKQVSKITLRKSFNYVVCQFCVLYLCLCLNFLSIIIMSHFQFADFLCRNNRQELKNRVMGEKKHNLSGPSDSLL